MRFRDGLKGRERGSRPARRGDPNMSKIEAKGRPAIGAADAWAEELRTVPELTETTFHLITGLLLPIWNWLGSTTELRGGRSPADRRRRTHHRAARLSRGVGQGLDPWAAVLFGRPPRFHLASGLARRGPSLRAHSAWSSPASAITASTAGAGPSRDLTAVFACSCPSTRSADRRSSPRSSIATLSCAAWSRRRGRPDNPVTNGE